MSEESLCFLDAVKHQIFVLGYPGRIFKFIFVGLAYRASSHPKYGLSRPNVGINDLVIIPEGIYPCKRLRSLKLTF